MKKKPDNLIGTILKVLGMILTILVFILSSLRVVDSHTGLGLLSLAVAFFGLYIFSLEKVEKEVIVEEEIEDNPSKVEKEVIVEEEIEDNPSKNEEQIVEDIEEPIEEE